MYVNLITVQCDPATTCNGHGTCQEDGSCKCSDGFYGDFCSSKSKKNSGLVPVGQFRVQECESFFYWGNFISKLHLKSFTSN